MPVANPAVIVSPTVSESPAMPAVKALAQAEAQPAPTLVATTETVAAAASGSADLATKDESKGVAEAEAASPWDDLMRRVTAWANPLRRSMEPYCQEGQARKP